jgi:RHS repeat-associated protein
MSILAGGALLLGTLAAPLAPTVSLNPGGNHTNVQLTSGGVSPAPAPYSAGEMWGGGADVEPCAVCSPGGLLKESGGQSTQPGQDVNPELGDFTTSQDLFDVPAVGGDLAMSMTYDSGYAAAERDLGAPAGYFGYGWTSTMSSSASVSESGAVTINDQNTAQYTFQSTTNDYCPYGDYETPQAYTIGGSNDLYCAPNRTNAELGYFSYGGFYQLNKDGGREIDVYNAYGQLAEQSNLTDTNLSNGGYIGYVYNVTAGSTITGTTATCPSLSGSTSTCWAAKDTDSPKRVVVAAVDAFGLVIEVVDPMGRVYQMQYTDGDGNLNLVIAPTPQSGETAAFTTYVYTTGSSSNYKSDMNVIRNPNLYGQTVLNTTLVTYSSGMVKEVQDAYGNATQYTYEYSDCANPSETDCTQGYQEVSVTYADGENDSDTYDDGLLVTAIFGPGVSPYNTWTFNYTEPPHDNQDAPTSDLVDMPSGTTATIVTDSVGNVLSYTDPNGNTTTSTYSDYADDASGSSELSEVCWTAAPGVTLPSDPLCGTGTNQPSSGATIYTYDTFGDLTSETDPMGNTTNYGYYENGLLCWEAPPSITATGTACANNGTSPSGAPSGATTYEYDAKGDVVNTTQPDTSTTASTTTSEYDADGEILYSIPSNGQATGSSDWGSNPYETATSYDPDGSVEAVTTPGYSSSQTTSYTYDADGNVLTTTDPAGATTETYDVDDRVCWSERSTVVVSGATCGSPPSTGATTYAYLDDTDAPTSVTDPDGSAYVTSYGYGDQRYPTSPTSITEASVANNSPTHIVTYNSYDTYGNTCLSGPVEVSTGSCTYVSGDTGDSYNAEGQLNNSENPDDETTTYHYSDGAFPTDATQVENSLSEYYNYKYNADGQLYQSEDPAGNWVTTGYNDDSQPCYQAPSQTSASCTAVSGSLVSTLTYDLAGNRSTMTDNVGQSNQSVDDYSYDANGNLLSAQNDNGQTNYYAYDDANQVTCVSYVISTTQSCSSSPGSSNSVVDDSYNSADQPYQIKDWLSNTISYTAYNPLSEPQTITYPSSTGESVGYTYDLDGNYTGSSYSGTSIAGLSGTNSSTPNNDDQVGSSQSLYGNSNSTSSPLDTYNGYDQVTSATNPANSSCGLSSCADQYQFSDGGMLQQDTPPGASEHAIGYSYNGGAQLTSIDNPNSSTPDSSFQYNTDGERCWSLESVSAIHTNACSSSAPSGATSYGWNDYGEMCWAGPTTSTTSSCTSPPSGVTQYSYDGNGLLSKETGTSSSRTFDWDLVSGGSTPLMLSNGKFSFIYGPQLFGGTAPIEEIDTSSNTAQFVSSTPSGVQAVFTGGSTPTLKELAAYSIWGIQTLEVGTAISPFGFDGSYNDSAIGSNIDYLINRYYDPSTDQFLSVDPLVAETGQPYAFVGDDPLNRSDPLGQIPTPCGANCAPGEQQAITNGFAAAQQTAIQAPISSSAPSSKPATPTNFAVALLNAVSAPASKANIQFILSWAELEGGNDWNGNQNPVCKFNPLDAGWMDGSVSCNSSGVQSYPSWMDGITAVSHEIERDYPLIGEALQQDDQAQAGYEVQNEPSLAPSASPQTWGTDADPYTTSTYGSVWNYNTNTPWNTPISG